MPSDAADHASALHPPGDNAPVLVNDQVTRTRRANWLILAERLRRVRIWAGEDSFLTVCLARLLPDLGESVLRDSYAGEERTGPGHD
jgi:hypothetical protein